MARSRARKKRSPMWFRGMLLCLLIVLLVVTYILAVSDSGDSLVKKEVTKSPVFIPVDDGKSMIYEEPSYEPVVVEPVLKHPIKGMALIMDDVGYDLKALQRVLNLPFDVAISVLPGAPRAKRAAEMAHADGQVVMLHLPMEPNNPKYQAKMTSDFLRVDMDQAQVLQTFEHALTRVPHVEGVNNHMGSLLTSMRAPMQWVIELCREKGLFFVDSKTAANSVAADVASNKGVAWAERRVFLDHRVEPEALAAAWRGALACVKRHNGCIVIAHPHAETLNFLEQHVSKNDMRHIQPVTALLYEN